MWWLDNAKPEFKKAFMAGFYAVSNAEEEFERWWKEQHELYPIDELDLPIRAYNAFWRNGIRTIGDVRKSLDPETAYKFDSEVPFALDIRNFGWKTYEQSKDALRRWDEAAAKEEASEEADTEDGDEARDT